MSTPAIHLVKEAVEGVLGWEYQTKDSVMLTYQESRQSVFPEDFLARVYYRLKEERSLHKIFPGMNVDHLNKFLVYMSKAEGLVICCLKTQEKPRPVGFGWITGSAGCDGARRAEFGFGFFKEVWGWQQNVDLSRFMLHYWFCELKIDILYGTTLKTNRLALRYSKHFGFEYRGMLPMFFTAGNHLVDAELITLKKTDFLPLYAAWRKAN